jgi:hypothetical protein
MPIYYATYVLCEPRQPVGVPVELSDPTLDTLRYYVELLAGEMFEPEAAVPIGSLHARRVLISRILEEGRSVLESMDAIDQLQHDIYAAVWHEEEDRYKDGDALSSDLVIFEPLEVLDGVGLLDFDVNRVLDDLTYQLAGGAGLAVYDASYARFTRFNIGACNAIPGVGYVRPGSHHGLGIPRAPVLGAR